MMLGPASFGSSTEGENAWAARTRRRNRRAKSRNPNRRLERFRSGKKARSRRGVGTGNRRLLTEGNSGGAAAGRLEPVAAPPPPQKNQSGVAGNFLQALIAYKPRK
jgi:hypothetical protein